MMFPRRVTVFVILLLTINGSPVLGQDVDATVTALNEALGPTYVVSHKGKMLVVESFREGQQVKVDKINVFDLDTASIAYSSDENVVSIKCYSDLDACVERTLIINKKKSFRQRLAFGVEEGRSGSEIESKLRTMVISLSNKY
ncbi:MAG: hypothetical protein RL266_832 [Bacteroidota bacterium]|jgi:hypothetical protein